jgi:hypothetical protein
MRPQRELTPKGFEGSPLYAQFIVAIQFSCAPAGVVPGATTPSLVKAYNSKIYSLEGYREHQLYVSFNKHQMRQRFPISARFHSCCSIFYGSLLYRKADNINTMRFFGSPQFRYSCLISFCARRIVLLEFVSQFKGENLAGH